MTTALERLKKECPDWPDWPKGAVEATVKMMQDYAKDVAQEVIDKTPSVKRLAYTVDH